MMNGPCLDDEKELFRLTGAGDADAFTVLFNRYTDRLFSYVLKLTKSDIWAEEIVQEIWTQVWIKRRLIGSVEEPLSYLYRIATNKTVDWMRHNRLDIKIAHYLKQNAANSTNNTEEQIEFNQCRRVLLEAIDRLPAQRGLVFQLKNAEGLSYAEIADRLHISKNTVRNQMVKSLRSIRDHLKQQGSMPYNYPAPLFIIFFIAG